MNDGVSTILELLWVVIISVGMSFGTANLIAAWREREAMQAAASPFGLTLLTGNLMQVLVRTLAQTALLFSGIVAIANPGRTCGNHRGAMHVIEVAMFVAATCLTVNSIVGWDMRHRLTRLITVGETSASMNREKEE